MARLGLKNYQAPNFKIPSIAPDQRPINQLSKFMQWLHSIVDWKVKDDNEKEEDTSADGEKELDEALANAPNDDEINDNLTALAIDNALSREKEFAERDPDFKASERIASELPEQYENRIAEESDEQVGNESADFAFNKIYNSPEYDEAQKKAQSEQERQMNEKQFFRELNTGLVNDGTLSWDDFNWGH